jgi:hypothetical protein
VGKIKTFNVKAGGAIISTVLQRAKRDSAGGVISLTHRLPIDTLKGQYKQWGGVLARLRALSVRTLATRLLNIKFAQPNYPTALRI